VHTFYPGKVKVTAVLGKATTAGINMVTHRGGRIVGQVTDANTGSPVQGARVNASGWSGATAATASDGTFVVGGLDSGQYTVGIGGQGYLAEYVPHTPDSAAATKFDVSVNNTTIVNETLLPGNTLTGTVTDATNGLPVSDILVVVEPLSGTWQTHRSDTTGLEGKYTAEVLGPGSYSVCFIDPRSTAMFADRCYKNQPFDYGTGTPVVIDGYGNTRSGVDQALPRSG
jgi:hypothetical protein